MWNMNCVKNILYDLGTRVVFCNGKLEMKSITTGANASIRCREKVCNVHLEFLVDAREYKDCYISTGSLPDCTSTLTKVFIGLA